MSIDSSMVVHVAHLARLELSNEEVRAFTGQLSDILDHVEKLSALDTSGVEPTFHVDPAIANVLRPDRPGPTLEREQALANAPSVEGGCFKVPPVIERPAGADGGEGC